MKFGQMLLVDTFFKASPQTKLDQRQILAVNLSYIKVLYLIKEQFGPSVVCTASKCSGKDEKVVSLLHVLAQGPLE